MKTINEKREQTKTMVDEMWMRTYTEGMRGRSTHACRQDIGTSKSGPKGWAREVGSTLASLCLSRFGRFCPCLTLRVSRSSSHSVFYIYISHIYVPASGQAVVTGRRPFSPAVPAFYFYRA